MNMRQTKNTLIVGVVVALVSTGCEMSKGHKKAEKATNSTAKSAMKMSELSEKAGCDRGLFIVEAMKDYTKESGGFRVQGGGYAAKEPIKPSEAYMVLSDVKPKDFKSPELADLGPSMPVMVGAELDNPTQEMAPNPAGISASMNAMTSDPSAAAEKVSDAENNPSVEFVRTADMQYRAKSENQSIGGVNTAQVKKFALARRSASTSAEVGVGPVKSTMLGATAMGYGGFIFPTDVESPSAELSGISGNVKDGFSIKIASPAAVPGAVSFLTVEVRNYPPTNSPKDWRLIAYRNLEEAGDGSDVEIKIPSDGKLKEGKVVVDITRSSLAPAKAVDANGNVCVETRSTARVYGNIGKAPEEV